MDASSELLDALGFTDGRACSSEWKRPLFLLDASSKVAVAVDALAFKKKKASRCVCTVSIKYVDAPGGGGGGGNFLNRAPQGTKRKPVSVFTF